jgi:hypothetical protein
MTADTMSHGPGRLGSRRLTWAVAVAIGIQVAVPAIALFNHPPTRFGFQMYSGKGATPVITTVDRSGHAEEIDLSSLAANARPEIDWVSHVPRYLCATRPEIVSVHVVESDPRDEGTYRCPR